MDNPSKLTEERIAELVNNEDLIIAIRQQRAEERIAKQKNQAIEKLKRIIARNPHLISVDMNKAGIRNTSKLTAHCDKMGYKIWGNLIEINPEPIETINPIQKLNQELSELTEKKDSYARIIASITERINEINAEKQIIKKKDK